MNDWVKQAGDEAGPCPSCGARAARPIVYGMPIFDDFRELEGEVVFAGCLLPEDPPAYSCGVCGHTWGELPPPDSEPLRSVFDDLD